MASSLFSVSWQSHQKNICKGLSTLQQKGEFVDMTITADGHHAKVHQMVLSLVSPYIKELIKSAQCPHPVIFLNRVSHKTLQYIREYAYTGEVLVTQNHLSEFLEACKALCIKGLEYESQAKPGNSELLEDKNSTTHNEIFETEFIGMEGVDEDDDDDDDDDDTGMHVHTAEKHKPPFDSRVTHTQDSAVEATETPSVQPSKIQYSVSTRGYLQVVVNRFMYSLRHVRRNNERYWRCVYQQKIKCRAAVATKDNEVLERMSKHNHGFHDKQIYKRKLSNNLFTVLEEADEAALKKRKFIQDIKNSKDLFNILDNE